MLELKSQYVKMLKMSKIVLKMLKKMLRIGIILLISTFKKIKDGRRNKEEDTKVLLKLLHSKAKNQTIT